MLYPQKPSRRACGILLFGRCFSWRHPRSSGHLCMVLPCVAPLGVYMTMPCGPRYRISLEYHRRPFGGLIALIVSIAFIVMRFVMESPVRQMSRKPVSMRLVHFFSVATFYPQRPSWWPCGLLLTVCSLLISHCQLLSSSTHITVTNPLYINRLCAPLWLAAFRRLCNDGSRESFQHGAPNDVQCWAR